MELSFWRVVNLCTSILQFVCVALRLAELDDIVTDENKSRRAAAERAERPGRGAACANDKGGAV